MFTHSNTPWSWLYRKGYSVALALASALLPRLDATAQAQSVDGKEINSGAGLLSTASLRLTVQGESITVNISKVPLRKVLAELAEQANIKVFVADTVPDDELSDAFDKLPFESAIKRLLAGKGYALRNVQALTPSDPAEDDVQKPKRAELYVVPQGFGVTTPYRMEPLDGGIEENLGKDASLLKKALHSEKASDRAAALKQYLNEAEDPDYEAVTEALNDSDRKVREVALEGMEDSNTLLVEATAETALTDTEPALRMAALRILVKRKGGAAQGTLNRALADPDPRVRGHAREMAKLANAIEAFRIRREARRAKQEPLNENTRAK